MSPVAQATNILQAETNTQMGWLLPTIHLLTVKLDKVKLQLKYCKPLVDAVQTGIKNRFGEMMEDAELIAAAILLPKFRTTWTKDDATTKMGKAYKCFWVLILCKINRFTNRLLLVHEMNKE